MYFTRRTLFLVKRHHYFVEFTRGFAKVMKEPSPSVSNSSADKNLKEVTQHFSNCKIFNQEFQYIPKKILLKKPKQPENLHLLDENVAKYIVHLIKDDIIGNGVPILECNPGFCLATKELLAAGASSIRLFEMDPFFKYYCLKLVSENEGRVSYFAANFLQFWKMSYQDLMDRGNRLKGIMDGIETKKWQDKPVLNFFSVLMNSTFLRHIVFNIIFQSGVVTFGRPELYILLPPNIYLQIREDKDCGRYQNRTFTTLCSLFFDCHLYDEIDRKAFVPWQSSTLKLRKMCQSYNLKVDCLYLVKLTPKLDLLDVLPGDSLKLLWFFVKHHLGLRTTRVIPSMEMWVPGCGPRLISMGHSTFSLFSELSSKQVFELFLEFSSWPEFKTCAFLPAMESTTLKMLTPSDLEITTVQDKKLQQNSDLGTDQ